MARERIGDMTREDLEAWVVQLIERRLRHWPEEAPDERSPREILASIRKHRIARQPGEATTLEMLREDRDR